MLDKFVFASGKKTKKPASSGKLFIPENAEGEYL